MGTAIAAQRGAKRLTLLKFNSERWSSVVGAIVVAGHAPSAREERNCRAVWKLTDLRKGEVYG